MIKSLSFIRNLGLSSLQIMGILNITPNSFSTVGRFQDIAQALAYAEQIATDGAAIIGQALQFFYHHGH